MAQHSDDTRPKRKGDLSTYLEGLQPRPDGESPLDIATEHGSVLIDRPEHVVLAAVAVMILERSAERGGTSVPVRDVRALREELTRPFSSRDIMQMEVEAYELMSWLAGLDPTRESVKPTAPVPKSELVTYDPDMPVVELLTRAIAEEFDVEIQYYTQSRGELNRRRITPLELRAEQYLHAYCHTRRDERVFRVSRIAEIRPVDGKPIRRKPPNEDPDEGADGGPAQGQLEL